jgi:hypothetical protein
MINLDVAATAYYQSGSLLELAVKILDRRNIGKEINKRTSDLISSSHYN